MNRLDLRVGTTLFYKEPNMDNLGLVAPEPNPFVNTGLPKPGQVWSLKNHPECLVYITKYSSFGHCQVCYTVLTHYTAANPRHRTLTERNFLKHYSFSH